MKKIIEQVKFGAIDTLVKFEERVVRNQPWVSWGQNNQFVNGLYELMDFSPIHNACVRSKIDNIVGQGFVNDYRVSPTETLNDVFRDMVFDYIVTGNIFIETIWKQERQNGLSGIHYIPSKYMRVGAPENAELIVNKFFYCRDWLGWKKAGVIEFEEFNPKVFTSRQVVQVRDKNPFYWAYGSPQYLSVVNDIRLNHEITVYNLANLINGANPSLWVHFSDGFPQSETEERNILQRLEQRYEGANNAGKMIVSFSEGEQGRPLIEQIQSNLQQGFYQEVFDLVQNQILSGHKIPDGSLIGLPQRTGFNSSADLLKTAHTLFMETSIKPIQKFLLRELKPLIELVNPNEEINLEIIQNKIIE